MKVRNWMQRDPISVGSDTLVTEAKRILAKYNTNALPVLDDGKLRGVITRVSCLRATEFVTRTQDPNEFNYLINRLKVKDLMVRNPVTLKSSDTMEYALKRGQELKVGQFPVMEDGKVVGLISKTEIFKLAAQFLGAFERWSGITLEPVEICHGQIGRIVAIAESAGANVHSINPVSDETAGRTKRVILRFECDSCNDLGEVVEAFEAAGYKVLEVDNEVQKTSD